jgi:hypothetical protein
VSALLDLLPEFEGAGMRRSARPVPMPEGPQRHTWVGAAVALAAGLAVAAYFMPKPAPPVAAVRPEPVTPAIVPQVATASAALVPEAIDEPAPRRVRRVRKAAPDREYFIALDDEPFESGVIMRMDVKPGNVQADVVFGPDGRAHAFRLVNASQRQRY